MSLMNLSQENRIEEINLDEVKGKVIIGSDCAGVYFLAGNVSNYYSGVHDFLDFVKKFGLITALRSDTNLFRRSLTRKIDQDKEYILIGKH